MSVVLLILKIIGIILLLLLGLILLAVLLVLFVPVRYRIAGQAENTIDSISVRAKMSWLLYLVSFAGQYTEQEFTYKLRILGIPIRLEKKDRFDEETRKASKKEKHKKKEKPKPKPEKQLKVKEKPEHEKQLKVEEKPEYEKQLKVEEKPEYEKQLKVEKKPEYEKQLKVEEKPEHEKQLKVEEKPESQKKVTFFQKIRTIPGMIRSKLEKIKEKLVNFHEVVSRIKRELQDEQNRAAAAIVFRELKYLLRHISPRKVTADVSFGMEDPAATGQILGVISTLPFIYRYKLQIYPDFATDTTYFNGTFDIKGHIRGIHFIIMAIHLFRDKNIQHLIRRYRNS